MRVEEGFSRGNMKSWLSIYHQLMIKKTSMSGVVFTHELNTGAPYLVIKKKTILG